MRTLEREKPPITARSRGERGVVAMGLLSQAILDRLADIANANERGVRSEPRHLLRDVNAMVGDEVVRQWCADAQEQSKGTVRSEDAVAAATALYFREAMWRPGLARDYLDQMAAIVVRPLKRTVLCTQLHLLKQPGPDEDLGSRPPRETHVDSRDGPNLWEELYHPLAEIAISSITHLRVMTEVTGARRAVDCAFGWAPTFDSLDSALRYCLTGQVASGFLPGALLGSPFARYTVSSGLARVVRFRSRRCRGCGQDDVNHPGDVCLNCDGKLEDRVGHRLLSIAYLERCLVRQDARGICFWPPHGCGLVRLGGRSK